MRGVNPKTIWNNGSQLLSTLSTALNCSQRPSIALNGSQQHRRYKPARLLCRIWLPDGCLFECDMDIDAFDERNPGNVYLRLFAELGKQDIMRFAGDMPQQFVKRYPNRPLSVKLSLNGNMRKARVSGLDVSLPTAFKLFAEGYAIEPMDIGRMKAELKMRATTYDLGFATALASLPAGVRIPSNITMNASIKADRQLYSAEMRIKGGKGLVTAKGKYNHRMAAYTADAR